MGNKCEDIFSLHAELIHKAADVQQQTEYQNGLNTAQIIDVEGGNVQRFLENLLSKTGLPIKNEMPTGNKDNQNLEYTTEFEFIPDSLEVYLSGILLNGDQDDPDRDYDVISTGVDAYKKFQIRLEPNKRYRLNCPPQQSESLIVNYNKRITFNTKGGN
jgi:hypothetical protein